MDRDLALTAVLAVLAVLSLGAAAATLDTAVETGGTAPTGSGGGPVDQSGDAADDGDSGDEATSGGGGGLLFEPVCVPALKEPRVIVGLLAVVAALGYAVYRRTGSVLPPVAFGLALGAPAVLLWMVLTSCGPPPGLEQLGLPMGGNATGGGLVGGPEAEGGGGGASAPEAAFAIVLVFVLLASVTLLLVSTGEDDEAEAPPGTDEDDPIDVAAIGRTAGAAADRIEADADVDNEVFRAWREMTAQLDVDRPQSSTPAEFASAAVDAGMARADVDELTGLFEEVRYGGATATERRERRAVDALRRIESAYATDDGWATGDRGNDADGDDADGDDRPAGDDEQSTDGGERR